ncbi:male sterility protein-domain-containing protein [Nemania sp. FL0031]|nr:male sterility protein-domain-containing protein [Nemania sp. FL0031]
MPYINDSAPAYGERLIPNIIDDIAANDPLRVFASIPLTEDLSGGYLDVSYQSVANAINRVCWWLSESLGLANTAEVFSYMGPNDLRYPIFLVAAIKCGYQMMLPSPRNSREYQIELLQRSGCKTVLCARSHTRYLDEIQAEDELDVFCIVAPDLSEILEETEVEGYPFNKSYLEIRKQKFMILHTSGSTGPPKPITFSIECTTTEDAHQSLDDPSHRLWWRLFANKRYFLGMPCFHSAGIWCALFMPVYFGSTVVYGPATRPLTSDIAVTGIVSGRIAGGFYPPSVLDDLSKSTSSLKKLRILEFVAYGGGALSKSTGDKISRLTTLHNFIGFTEASAPPRFVMDPEDWNYFEFHPASGFVAKHHHDDLYRMTFERHSKYEHIQSCFRILPDLMEYSPGDLISRHPTKETLWKHRGRIDDLVVLSNGEKFNPISIEDIIKSCHYVGDVIMSGEGRFQASLLVERDPKTASRASAGEVIDELWPFVERANISSSTHSRITKSLIFIAPSQKPFYRSAKGTLQRKATIKSFEAELNELYATSRTNSQSIQRVKEFSGVLAETRQDSGDMHTQKKLLVNSVNSKKVPLPEEKAVSGSKSSIPTQKIRKIVATACGVQSYSDKEDLFGLGMDSLRAVEIADRLREASSLWPQDREASLKLLYANPSIQGIVDTIKSRHNTEAPLDLEVATQASKSDESGAPIPDNAKMAGLLEKYTADLDELPPTRAKTVVLTGATGSLGCYLLELLIREPSISRIICLHRGDSGKERQIRASEKRGLSFNPEGTTVDFFQIDLSQRELGLSPDHLADIYSNADAIIHNAWDVDFNKHLGSFEIHIAGVRHLADLAARSQRQAKFIFVSSIASVINWDSSLGDVPEKVLLDESAVGSSGYSQSKYTAEKILQRVAASTELSVSIIRVGQMAGPITLPGSWNASEWLPMLVKTSKALGILPKSLGNSDDIDWVPIDVTAEVFMDVLRHKLNNSSGDRCQVYHISNPHKTTWGALLPATCQILGSDIKLVTFHEWVRRLQLQGSVGYDVERFPALKILPFYKGMVASPEAKLPVLDTQNLLSVSTTLASVEEVQGIWMERWIQSWNKWHVSS